MKSALPVFLLLAACVPMASPAATPSPAAIQQQQREAFAQSMGHPTTKSPEELERVIQQQTHDFHRTGHHGEVQLAGPAPLTIAGVQGTCYTLVMRLAPGAAWGVGAEAGLRFDFHAPARQGSGGPGVTGPGAVVSVGCAEASGPITLTMAPLIGQDPIGQGTLAYELWSHKLTRAEAAHLEADKQRQIQEQREFAAREAAKRQQRATTGCAACDGRYQGCIGAGRSRSVCSDEYGRCAFEHVGPDYLSACPRPND